MEARRKYSLPDQPAMPKTTRVQLAKLLQLTLGMAAMSLLASCATTPGEATAASSGARRIENVRTTAYTHSERGGGGPRNALGKRLSRNGFISAASDWSVFPLGTKFRVVDTGQTYVIDDYGGALVGTSTIDLYKTSRAQVRRWGVRRVTIDILNWGSDDESLKVLSPRRRHGKVRRMVVALQAKQRRHDKKRLTAL